MSRFLATSFVALAMFAAPSLVTANSSGLGIPCDVDNPTLGRADRMKAYMPNNASVYWPMWWTTPQKWSDDSRYTLRAGDGAAGTDATQYTPGQYTEITIRANVQDKQFTGLLMYAVNAANQKVGEWLLPPRQAFQIDPSSGCVTHSNADPKKYKSVFRVKFPRGTGEVTIKALVKYGLAFPELQGEFWYPNTKAQGHLKLQEGSPQNQIWFQGATGQSCNQVCQAAGGTCDLPTMQSTGSSSALLSAVAKTSTCFGPLMKGCGAYSPTVGTEGCWYQDSTCTRESVTTDWDPCTAGGVKPYVPGKVYQPNNANDPACCSYQGYKWCANYYITETPNERQYGPWRKVSACTPPSGNPTLVPTQAARSPVAMDCTSTKNSDRDGRRLCACSGVTGTPDVPDTPTSSPDDTTQPKPGTPTITPGGQVPLGDSTGKNTASRMAPHMLITLLSVLLGAIMSPVSRSSRAIFIIVAAIAILGDLPGSSAHNWLTSPSRGNGGTGGGDNNFNGNTAPPCPPKGTRVHAQVAAGQRFQMEWASGHGYGSSTYLAVLRASDEASLNKLTFEIMDDYIKNAPANANVMTDSKAYHVSPVDASRDKSYINQDITSTFVRPTNFRKYPKVFVYSKTAAATAGDRRVSYQSVKYPYLVAVHRFALHEDRPDEMDGAWMEIPQGYPSGQYVIQYQWRGYYDCMDINVLDVQSTDIYGSPAADNTGMDKYLHTMYTPSLPKYQALDKSCKELGDGDTIEACQTECLSKNDPETGCTAVTVAPATLNTNIVKFKGMFSNGQSHLPPTCAGVAKNPNNLVCYLVHAGQAPTVGPAYKAVSDPEDPVFYMTTYIRKSGWQFAQACSQCVPPLPPADWRFSDKCISCSDVARNFFTQAPPRWNFIDNCQHCDNTLG